MVVFDGTRVGEECVIGAGAVVNSDIPDWQIAVGIPAKPVKDRRKLKDEQEMEQV